MPIFVKDLSPSYSLVTDEDEKMLVLLTIGKEYLAGAFKVLFVKTTETELEYAAVYGCKGLPFLSSPVSQLYLNLIER